MGPLSGLRFFHWKTNMPNVKKTDKQNIILTAVLALLTIAVFFIPTHFGSPATVKTIRSKAKIIEVDNSTIEQCGIVITGDQGLTFKIMNGPFKGTVLEGNNLLMGKMDIDKLFDVGDKALVTLYVDDAVERILSNQVVDHYRTNIELILLVLFAAMLIGFAGWTGVKALLSFIFTAAAIWKILIPGLLTGISPMLLSLAVVSIMTAVIVFLVAGISRMGAVAFLGAMSGIAVTAVLSLTFGRAFKIHGAVKPFAETLLYSGYPTLNLTSIFLSGIFMAASGAVMDIAMDIAASMREVKDKHPLITRSELIRSGFRVGRAVIGTMTTTLLLAYSGGYTFILMVFVAQGTPLVNVFNIIYVSSEILHTIVGSFGLVLVAPLTALIGGFLYSKEQSPKSGIEAVIPKKRAGS